MEELWLALDDEDVQEVYLSLLLGVENKGVAVREEKDAPVNGIFTCIAHGDNRRK